MRLVGWLGSGDLTANARANCYAVFGADGEEKRAGDVCDGAAAVGGLPGRGRKTVELRSMTHLSDDVAVAKMGPPAEMRHGGHPASADPCGNDKQRGAVH